MSVPPVMLEALRAAVQTGSLRRLVGGWWVRDDYPAKPPGHVPEAWIDFATIKAAAKNGLFRRTSWYAHITEAGRRVVEQNRDVDLSHLPPYNRITNAPSS